MAHPFPSLLNGVATGLIAILAGGAAATALRLGVAMVAIQVSIGILNDLVDAPRDAGRIPAKPIAAGLVSPAVARTLAILAAGIGFILSAVSGFPTLGIALAGAACGYLYDLGLSRTAIGWLPLAIALPLVPLYAWLGATGTVPPALGSLVPIAILAGAGLAIGNDLVDAAADAHAGTASIAARLGPWRAWLLHGAALAGAIVLVAGSLAAGQGSGAWIARPLALGGAGLVAVGAALLAAPSRAAPDPSVSSVPPAARSTIAARGRAGWAIEAVGVAGLGIGWLVAVAGT